MNYERDGRKVRQGLRRVLGGCALCACLMACGSGADDSTDSGNAAQPANFEEDAEAVRFVRGLTDRVAKGEVPSQPDVQRLKELALMYSGEDSIEAIHMSLLVKLEDWEGLAVYFQAKPELTPDERFTLTWAYLKQMDYLRARGAIEDFARTHGESLEAQRLLARACYFLDEFDLAAGAYDKVWDQMLSQGLTTDIAYRAMIDFDRGDIPRALSLLNGALQATPNSVPVLNSLSRVLASQGKLQEAEGYSKRVTRLQEAHNQTISNQRRRASRVIALNTALGEGDYTACEQMVFQWLPDAEEDFAAELVLFLEKIYRLVGREAELDDVLNRAQAARRKQ